MKHILLYSMLVTACVSGCQGEGKSLKGASSDSTQQNTQDVSFANQLNETGEANSFIVSSYSPSTNDIDILQNQERNSVIKKLDNSGNLIWQTLVNGTVSELAKSIVPSPDGGCFIVEPNKIPEEATTEKRGMFMADSRRLPQNRQPGTSIGNNDIDSAQHQDVAIQSTAPARKSNIIKSPGKAVQMNLWFPN